MQSLLQITINPFEDQIADINDLQNNSKIFFVNEKTNTVKHPVIHIHQPLEESLQKALLYYNNLAVSHLEKKTRIHYHIHEARLCCKRIRSLLRLVRPGMDPEMYARFNAFYRDHARELSAIRDLTALSESLQALLDSIHNEKNRKFLVWFRNQLLKKRYQIANSHEFDRKRIQVRKAFEQQNEPITMLRFDGSAGNILGRGLQRIYRRGMKDLNLNLEQTDDHIMHQWRKQVKYLWYQLVYLQPLWPQIIEPFAMQFRELSKQLGSHHDLVVLLEALKELKSEGKMVPEIRLVEQICRHKKRRLEKSCLKAGKKLFLIPGKGIDDYFSSLYDVIAG